MDTDQTINHSRARFAHETNKRVLREKYLTKMIFGYNGGMFRTTPEMITFLALYGDQQIVIEDLYGNPVKVDARELCDIMKFRWQEQMNAWLAEYDQSTSQR